MRRVLPFALTIFAGALAAATAPLAADRTAEPPTVLDGRCQYSDAVARHRDDTLLILCDRIAIHRDAKNLTLDFSRRSWGSTARFSGAVVGDRMAVASIALRNGASVKATGTCEIFRRNDGRISVVSCLGKAGTRPIAANFVPSFP